jgi:hypothetical protein
MCFFIRAMHRSLSAAHDTPADLVRNPSNNICFDCLLPSNKQKLLLAKKLLLEDAHGWLSWWLMVLVMSERGDWSVVTNNMMPSSEVVDAKCF